MGVQDKMIYNIGFTSVSKLMIIPGPLSCSTTYFIVPLILPRVTFFS